jgi:hypothetical protein
MEDLAYTLITSGDTVLFWVLAFVGALIARMVLGQIKSTKLKEYVGRALAEVGDAVMDVAQTYVKALKDARADGQLTSEEKRLAKEMALTTAKKNIGKEGLERLARILGFDMAALDGWLGTKIEAAVASLPTPGRKLAVGTPATGVKTGEITAPDPR